MYAMEKTYLTYLMEDEGPYTVFIPVQASFVQFRKENNISSLDQFPLEELTNILRYHFIKGSWTLLSLTQGYYPTLLPERTSGNPVDLYIENDDVLKLNGRYILDEPDLGAINGYVHSIKAVLDIPTILDHLSNNEKFSLVYQLLSRKDLDPEILELLSQDGPLTFLAPDNEAIMSYIDTNPAWNNIEDIPTPMLDSIIMNHFIVGENMVLERLRGNYNFTTVNGHELEIQAGYKKWTILDENGKVAHVTDNDIQGVNGIIQQVDRLLVP